MHLVAAAPSSKDDRHRAHLTSVTTRTDISSRAWGQPDGSTPGCVAAGGVWLDPASEPGLSIAFIAAVHVCVAADGAKATSSRRQ